MEPEIEAQKQKVAELEALLAHAESRLKVALDSSDQGVLIVDLNGRVLSINAQFIKLWHIPDKLADGADDEGLLAFVQDQLEDPEEFLNKVRDLYDSDAEAHDIVGFKDGRVFARYTRAFHQGTEHGRIWCFRDVTEQARYERSLKSLSARYQALLHNASDGIHILDSEANLIEASDSFCETLGYTRKELIGQHVSL